MSTTRQTSTIPHDLYYESFSPSFTMRILRERPQPGLGQPVSLTQRSTFSHFTSSYLILTTILLTLCSPVSATSDSECFVSSVDPFSHRNSHSFILGRRAQRDEINEITIDSRADPQHFHPKRQQDNDGKNEPPEPSDNNSKPPDKENNSGPGEGGGNSQGDSPDNSKPSDKENSSGPGEGGDNSQGDSPGNSKPNQDGNSTTGKVNPPPTKTSAQDRSSITTTFDSFGRTITAAGTVSAETEIQTTPAIDSEDDFPTAFDTNIGSNYTNPDCPKFIREFTKNTTFTDCLPMSMFLTNSDSFFKVSVSAPALSQILDASCDVSQSSCTTAMTDLASQLTDDSNCGEDFVNRQPVVRDAYEGLITYEPMYRATCLKNPDTHSYCYVDAATNTSNYEDSYIYLLALGYQFPAGSRPTCNRCLQATMEIFADTARVENQPLVDTYLPAAQMINMGCGPGFINTTVEVGTLPAIDAAPGGLLKSSSMLMGYVSFLSVGVTLLLLF